MSGPAYAVARVVAPAIAKHLQLHRASLPPLGLEQPPLELLPNSHTIESIVDAAFWASVRREEGYIPKISLAFLRPMEQISPLIFEQPIPLEPGTLTRLAAAVERPDEPAQAGWRTFTDRPVDGLGHDAHDSAVLLRGGSDRTRAPGPEAPATP